MGKGLDLGQPLGVTSAPDNRGKTMLLQGRKILVTFATHWAGPEICDALVNEGAQVVCHDPSFTDQARAGAFVAGRGNLTAIADKEDRKSVV